MPRGTKKDIAVTKLLRANKFFTDRRSFVSLGPEPHLYLKGDDMTRQWERLWVKWTKQGDTNPRCAVKFKGCDYFAVEMDHKQGGLVGRCDCEHNLRPICINCHRLRHVHPEFRKRNEEAIAEFNRIHADEPARN